MEATCHRQTRRQPKSAAAAIKLIIVYSPVTVTDSITINVHKSMARRPIWTVDP